MAEADPSIFSAMANVPEREIGSAAELDAAVKDAREPFLMRGLVKDWALVKAGQESPEAARQYLLGIAKDRPFSVSLGPPGHDGRIYYDERMGMNFTMARRKLADIFEDITAAEQSTDPACIYIGSVHIPSHFDGFTDANPLDLGDRNPRIAIWIGTPTRVAAHTDFPDNVACCAVGRRRFTLFPPDQFRNLYPGPLENTPAGREISMVDFHAPDFEKYPRFADALETAQVAELEPGDAIFIPSMWWHHVEGLSRFNILVNYWWRALPRYHGVPSDALMHAILSVRDLPRKDKELWRDMFEHYVFSNDESVTAHIPEDGRGILDPLTPETAGQLRAFLMRTLNQ